MMRVGALLRRSGPGRCSTAGTRAAGRALHVDGRKPHRPEVAEELLVELGLDPGLVAEAIADPTTGDEVRAEHDAVVAAGGWGVPTLVFPDGQALFGPVVIDPPTGDAAVRLWHLVIGWLEFPHLYEMQRPKRPRRLAAIADDLPALPRGAGLGHDHERDALTPEHEAGVGRRATGVPGRRGRGGSISIGCGPMVADDGGCMVDRALITGITGQDGSYLSELLLTKGYEVHGIVRRSSSFNTPPHRPPPPGPARSGPQLPCTTATSPTARNLVNLIRDLEPHEVYNLAAQSHVAVSFEMPDYTGDITGMGTVRLLEAHPRSPTPRRRFYQASSSEMFGSTPAAAERVDAASTRAAPTPAPRSTPTTSRSTTARPTGCSP